MAWVTLYIQLAVQRADTMADIHMESRPAHFPDRLKELQLVVRVRDCLFPVQGRFHLSLLVDGELVAQRRLTVVASET
jgi:hypothetical protein